MLTPCGNDCLFFCPTSWDFQSAAKRMHGSMRTASEPVPGFSLSAAEKQLAEQIQAQHQRAQEQLQTPYGAKLLACRRTLYQHPERAASMENTAAQLHFSVGYFRNLYRSFFDISYVQDCIAAKMNRAKYLLLSTSLHIEEIAVQCGYLDAKYFMRLSQKSIGCTPSQYRKKFI